MDSRFHSQAFNFASAIEGGVDPRTGLFGVSIPLATVNANYDLGPVLDLSLSYNSMSTRNLGFGIGFDLGLSSYDSHKGSLRLTTGEEYRVDEYEGTVLVKHQKLNTFKFSKIDDNTYKVVHKSGQVEILSGTDNVKLLTLVYSPAGHMVQLEWDTSGQDPCLVSIKDEHDTILAASYQLGDPEVTFWPGKSNEFKLNLYLDNFYLTTFVNHASEPSRTWKFGYYYLSDWLKPMDKVVSPTGMVQSVSYSKVDGMRFPDGSNQEPLPYVEQLRREPFNGQPALVTNYKFSSEANYLGRGLGGTGSWDANSDFGLGAPLSDYTYTSQEIQPADDYREEVTVTRTYNNYHLLIKEEFSRGACYQSRSTNYHAVSDGRLLADQPAYYQMPSSISTQYQNPDQLSKPEAMHTDFDEWANSVKQIELDCSATSSEYYDPKGEYDKEGRLLCPADPNGFKRFVKCQTKQPAPSSFSSLPVIKEFTYRNMQVCTRAKSHLDQVTVIDREIHKSGAKKLKEIVYTYVDKPDSPDHSRILEKVTNFEDTHNPGKLKSNVLTNSWERKDDQLILVSTFKGHDGISCSHSVSTNRFHGEKMFEIDRHGVKTMYSYDKLGRKLTQTENVGTDKEHTTNYEYFMESGEGEGSKKIYTTESDPKGNKKRVYYDGLGRAIKEERLDVDRQVLAGQSKWHTSWIREYNDSGRPKQLTFCENMREPGTDGKIITDNSHMKYDGWGQNYVTESSDGIQEYATYDPITRTMVKQLASGARKLAKRQIFYDLGDRPTKVVHYDASGVEIGSTQHYYDGLGQLRKEVDEIGNTTCYEYDNFGRVIKTTLPDGTVVSKTYAPYTSQNLVTSVRVNDIVMGVQSFDSLKRLTGSCSGGRAYKFLYEGSSPVPYKVIGPSGDEVEYKYIPELGNSVKEVSGRGFKQSFKYDHETGAMTEAQEEGGRHKRMDYYPSGLLKSETYTDPNCKSKTCTYEYSVSGLIQSFTDVFGETQHFRYDDQGRVIETNDNAIRVLMEYDVFNRLVKQDAMHLGSESKLTTRISYDDLDREIRRELAITDQETMIVEQSFHKNNLLAERIRKNGLTTLHRETFKYDNRNRLIDYTCTGHHLPRDFYGKSIERQTFVYDILGNITESVTTFTGGSNKATYIYSKPDPTQLLEVHNSHTDYPQLIKLSYDPEGRMITDEDGRTLSYDGLGRLREVKGKGHSQSGRYEYDALNTMVTQLSPDNVAYELYYRADTLVGELNRKTNQQTRYMKVGDTCLGQTIGNSVQLHCTNQQGTILSSATLASGKQADQFFYTAYGYSQPRLEGQTRLGFNGQRMDPVSGTYHLGNGYRAYNPVLMRFNCPDSWSPFGAGGINPYAYCLGDPINRADPTGHLSWLGWLGVALAVVVVGIATAGAGFAIAASVGAAATISVSTAALITVGCVTGAAAALNVIGKHVKETDPDLAKGLCMLGDVLGSIAASIADVISTKRSEKDRKEERDEKKEKKEKEKEAEKKKDDTSSTPLDNAPVNETASSLKPARVDLHGNTPEETPVTPAAPEGAVSGDLSRSALTEGSGGVGAVPKTRSGVSAEVNITSTGKDKATKVMGTAMVESSAVWAGLPAGGLTRRLPSMTRSSSLQDSFRYQRQLGVSHMNQMKGAKRLAALGILS